MMEPFKFHLILSVLVWHFLYFMSTIISASCHTYLELLSNHNAPPIPYFDPIELLIPYNDIIEAMVVSQNKQR